MQIKIISTFAALEQKLNYNLSLLPFREHLQLELSRSANANKLLEYVRGNIDQAVAQYGDLTENNIGMFKEQLQYIYNLVSPRSVFEDDTLWAMAGIDGKILCGTMGFYALHDRVASAELEMDNYHVFTEQTCYRLIMERLYGFTDLTKERFVFPLEDKKHNSIQYIQLEVDFTFLDVTVIGKELPKISFEKVAADVQYNHMDKLQEILPLNQFEFTGFSSFILKDVSLEYNIDRLKDLMLSTSIKRENALVVDHILGAIFGRQDYYFNVFPFLYVNGKLMVDRRLIAKSLLCPPSDGSAGGDDFVHRYLKKPYIITHNVVEGLDNTIDYIKQQIDKEDISSYICVPLYHNGDLTGIFELFTKHGHIITTANVDKIRSVLNVLAQLGHEIRNEFQMRINNSIIEKYTPIQPTVRWRFNEVAASELMNENAADIDNQIVFRDVSPLYGAIDVKNSTALRNVAMQKDTLCQFDELEDLLAYLKTISSDFDFSATRDELKFWRQKLNHTWTEEETHQLQVFLNKTHFTVLPSFLYRFPQGIKLVELYLKKLDKGQGDFYRNQKGFEESLQAVNALIVKGLDSFNEEVQHLYPSFFEKFRTDGVEFGLYVGQSLTPHKIYREKYLHTIREWQLQYMVQIAGQVRANAHLLPVLTQTTQLIYASSQLIDIGFRVDEQRFDVHGAYNTRYEIIKKRIDKIKILDSEERLTQPDTIAIVYTNKETFRQYMGYIANLQKKNILQDHIEYLELEEVQGILGLKAIRVYL